MTGTEINPIHKLRPEHLIGLSNKIVYYVGVSDTLNLFWAKDYVKQNNIELKMIRKN